MRRSVVVGAAIGVLNAATVALLAWVLRGRSEFGWYSYTPMPRRYADYLGAPASPVLNGWATVGVVAAALVVLDMAIAVALTLVGRRRSARAMEQQAQ